MVRLLAFSDNDEVFQRNRKSSPDPHENTDPHENKGVDEEWMQSGPHIWMWHEDKDEAGRKGLHITTDRRTKSVVSVSEDGRTYTLTESDSGKRFSVAGKEGKNLFQGPVDSDEDASKVPEEFRGKLK